jgi:alkanesulfonate monooxygenase SsuD/methylene tetrahydromethanopterin reductase-like flavin-dependent oxidoreductase (luciferase family)
MWRGWDDLVNVWTRAERAGYDAAFVADHLPPTGTASG